jgi:hypothetical protein
MILVHHHDRDWRRLIHAVVSGRGGGRRSELVARLVIVQAVAQERAGSVQHGQIGLGVTQAWGAPARRSLRAG